MLLTGYSGQKLVDSAALVNQNQVFYIKVFPLFYNLFLWNTMLWSENKPGVSPEDLHLPHITGAQIDMQVENGSRIKTVLPSRLF